MAECSDKKNSKPEEAKYSSRGSLEEDIGIYKACMGFGSKAWIIGYFGFGS